MTPAALARRAHERAVRHLRVCWKVPRGLWCETCDDNEADATRLAFAAEMAERREKREEGVLA